MHHRRTSMICKNCGNELPDGLDICFICDHVIKEAENDKKIETAVEEERPEFDESDLGYYRIPFHPTMFMDYKDVKRTFIGNCISFPALIVVLYFLIRYTDPGIAFVETILGIAGIYMGTKQMIAQYRVWKHHRERMKMREQMKKQNTSGGNI